MVPAVRIRHAETDVATNTLAGRTPGIRLTAIGQRQAEALAASFADAPLNRIYSSPLERAQQTAAALAHAKGLEVKVSAPLHEIDFGEWSGRTFDELNDEPDWRRWNEERSIARTPGGETMLDVQGRVVGCMEALAGQHRGGAVVLVSHADIIKAAVCHYLDLPVQGCFRFDVAPASITAIVTGDWGGKLLGLNEVVA